MSERDEADKDPLAAAFDAAMEAAVSSGDDIRMTKVAAAYRERAAYFEGRLDGLDDAQAHLRRLLVAAEPQRRDPEALRLGMMVARVIDATEDEDENEPETAANGKTAPTGAPAPAAPA